MRPMIGLTVALALAGCSKAMAPAAHESADVTKTAAPAATPAAFDINRTSWELTDPQTKKPIRESVDEAGKYIAVSGKENVDHGSVVMRNGKACFTSATTKEGEICWTDPTSDIGQSVATTSDKGVKLTVKRVAYSPLTL